MKKEKQPTTDITPPAYPSREEARRLNRRSFLLVIGGSTAASALFSCKSEPSAKPEDPRHRLPGKVARPVELPPDASMPDPTPPQIEIANPGAPIATAPVTLRISLPGLLVWSSDEPKLQGRSSRLSDGTRVSYALLFESANPIAKQTIQEKRGALMRIADSYLRNKCDYHSVANTGGKRQITERLAKMFDAVLKVQDIAFLQIEFLRVQEVIRKKGVKPVHDDELDF